MVLWCEGWGGRGCDGVGVFRGIDEGEVGGYGMWRTAGVGKVVGEGWEGGFGEEVGMGRDELGWCGKMKGPTGRWDSEWDICCELLEDTNGASMIGWMMYIGHLEAWFRLTTGRWNSVNT